MDIADDVNQIALKKYYNVEDPASYGGRARLLQAMKQYGWTSKQVESFLNDQNAYISHRERRYKFPRNKIITYHKDFQHQMDLMDMRQYASDNDGYKYILVIIDCFTRYCWLKALKTKDANSLKTALEELYVKSIPVPLRIQTDRGKEFINQQVKRWYKKHEIHFFTTQGTGFKCAMVERLNRTLKYRMFRYFLRNGKYRYIDILDKLAQAYNNSIHRTIGMTPEQARTKLPHELPMNTEPVISIPPKFKIGDKVRIAYDRDKMDRGFWKTHHDHVYYINRILREGEVPVYEVKDYFNTVDPRRYYQRELAPVGNVAYPIAAEHRKRVRADGKVEVEVSWLGYPPSFKTWILEEELTEAI